MQIYLTNPVHGARHAYSETEAQQNEKNGWVRVPEPTAEEIAALRGYNTSAEPVATDPSLDITDTKIRVSFRKNPHSNRDA